ncbi:MAG: DUF4058 family protein [Anaerolineae bacterium]|nr:DUF4058 family protein [Anaerolineales bacterium]MCQ3972628.1 hypothetical protein [Anaerolineae bacterium]
MPSPFPGMDPYLEGYLWPDVHQALANKFRQQLAPQIQPNYVARLEISVIEDTTFTAEVGVMYPDVEVLKIKPPPPPPPPAPAGGAAVLEAEAILTAPLTIPLPQVRLVSVEIRDVAQNQLVTCIEILSPVNKREPHLSQYRLKRLRLHEAGVHLLEIDLLRRGSRPWTHPRIPDTPYLALLTRAEIPAVEVWPIRLQDKLPLLPVPLRPPDKDATLDLAAALTAVYDEAYYHLSIDYAQEPPPPPLAEEETAWSRGQIKIEK